MAKVEELKRDIEIIAQNHEREVDRKDAILQVMGTLSNMHGFQTLGDDIPHPNVSVRHSYMVCLASALFLQSILLNAMFHSEL